MALVTASGSTDLLGDGPLLMAGLAAAGIDSEPVPWGAPVDWGLFDGVLLRACFDYVQRRDDFLAWAASVAAVTQLANPLDVLVWNTDKHYLLDLEHAGVPVVPTVWVEPAEEPATADVIATTAATAPGSTGAGDVVVKPAVSGGSRLAARYSACDPAAVDAAVAHIRSLQQAGQSVMVEPYLDSVDRHGETGTYVFDGEVSHAITKGAVLRVGDGPHDDFSLAIGQTAAPAMVDPRLADFARQVLAAMPFADPVLYARVDTVTDNGGAPRLLELEVTEPFLFLDTDPPAADRFAAAVRAWLSRGRRSGRRRS